MWKGAVTAATVSFVCLYMILFQLFLFLEDFYLFIFKERGKEGEREKHQRVVAFHTPPIGDLAHNPGMCPDLKSNQGPFSL